MPDPIRTRFSAESTAMDVVEGVDLTGLRAIVTGATSGLGVETARALAATGAEVVLAVRDIAKGRAVGHEIAVPDRPAPRTVALHLERPASVRALVDGWHGPLHLLVNNAGVVTSGLERTREGWELQFATNHLGHLPSPPASTRRWSPAPRTGTVRGSSR